MIQGTASNVGKSVLVAALCRIFARKGFRVAPFKSQNMALNSFVTPDGLELGRAQAVQAQAAGLEADVRMNPILLKPEADSRCQIMLMGKHWRTLSASNYYCEKDFLWKHVVDSLEYLSGEYDLVIIEGAGSPAEINLRENEIVNMRVALHAKAPVLLVGDIDRGGVFASLYGTIALLPKHEQETIKGFIINKFRGDVELLKPGLAMLSDLTGKRPTLGVIPYLNDLRIAQEDGVFLETNSVIGEGGTTDIAVIRFPHVSNYDDFDALAMEPGVQVRFVSSCADFGTPDAIILPGTKTTIADLVWLKKQGFAAKIATAAAGGAHVVGICGGYQMLGTSVSDVEGLEGTDRFEKGLELLDVTTVFRPHKTTQRTTGRLSPYVRTFISNGEDIEVEGYEIHMGETSLGENTVPFLSLSDGRYDGAFSENIWGTYMHGIFDTPKFRHAWLKKLGWAGVPGGDALTAIREREFERLADHVETHLDMRTLYDILRL